MMETAVNIGYASSLHRQDMKQIVITLDSLSLEKHGDKESPAKSSITNKGSTSAPGIGLIIDGKSLDYTLNKILQRSFFELAVMASDFAIAQFRFLERLLLVHGYWCYRRISMMICYFFYKNKAFGFTLFWFEAYASFPGQAAYNDWYMSFYNVFFTSLPVIALGFFDQDVSAQLSLKLLHKQLGLKLYRKVGIYQGTMILFSVNKLKGLKLAILMSYLNNSRAKYCI